MAIVVPPIIHTFLRRVHHKNELKQQKLQILRQAGQQNVKIKKIKKLIYPMTFHLSLLPHVATDEYWFTW